MHGRNIRSAAARIAVLAVVIALTASLSAQRQTQQDEYTEYTLLAPDTASFKFLHLARPVPSDGGQARIRIIKTYKDPKSYYKEGDAIVFNRGLGIRRNAVVLPAGYHLVSCNVPSQVVSDPDGRIRISFMHQAPGEAALVMKAKPGAEAGEAARPRPLANARS